MTQYQYHIQRYAPKGILGLGKNMVPCSYGLYVKSSELEKEQMKNQQLSSSLETLRLRERQLDGRVKQLEADFKQSELAALELVGNLNDEKGDRMKRDLALADLLIIADEIAKKASGKKGKALQDKYLEARDKLV